MRPIAIAFVLSIAHSFLPSASAQLSPPLLVPGDLGSSSPAGRQRSADVAWGSGSYLVVWEDTRAELAGSVAESQQVIDILAMRYDAMGQAIDASPIVVTQAPLPQTEPSVAWNGTDWLVVYRSSTWSGFASSYGIYAVRVSAAGTVLDPTPIVIDDDPFVDELDPSVTSDGSKWIVSWHDFAANGNTLRRLARIDGSGAVLNSSLLYSGSGNGAPFRVRMAFGGGTIVFVSEVLAAVVARRINPVTLSSVGGAVTLATDGDRPDVASDGANFYVTWKQDAVFEKIMGSTFSSTGNVGTFNGDLIATMNSGFAELRPDVAWDGVNYWIAVDQLGTGADQVEGYRVDAVGQVVGSGPIVITTAGAPNRSALAGGPTPGRLFAVWDRPTAGFEDLFGAVIQDGVVTELGALEQTPPNQTESDLAGDAQAGYLLVFLSRQAGTSRVMAMRLTGGGDPVNGIPFVVHSSGETLHTPRVAWNGSRWLVVWEKWPTPLTEPGAVVSYRLVAQDESFPQGAKTALSGNWPDVGALGSDFLIAASLRTSGDIRRVWYVTVDGNGTKSTSTMVGDNYASIPKVGAIGGKWLVAWQHKNSHDSSGGTAHFSFVNAAGLIVAGPTAVGGSHDTFDVSVMQDQFAIVASSDKDVYVNRFAADGTKFTNGFLWVSQGPMKELSPVIGNDGTRYLTSWNDYRIHTSNSEGIGDVFAKRLQATGPLYGPELTIAADAVRPEASGAVVGDMGVTIVSYHEFVADSTFTGWRTFLRVLDESSVCQPDIGFQGPGSTLLSMCGTGLATGQASDLLLTGALPNAFALIVVGFNNAPVPFLGGMLVPSDASLVVPISTDSAGERSISGVSGGSAASFTIYAQVLSADTGLTGGFAFSNALALTFQP